MHDVDRRVSIDGRTLAWNAWGEPTPGRGDLVLLHGYTGSSHDFQTHLDALAIGRSVYAIDHRGHGRSDHCTSADDYRVAHIAADCAEWLRTVVVPESGPVHLLGHSMGGRVALEVVLGWPELVQSLILMDTTAWNFGSEDPQMVELLAAHIEHVRTHGQPDTPAEPTDAGEPSPEELLLIAGTSGQWRQRREELAAAVDPLAMLELGEQLFTNNLEPLGDRLGDIDVATTVIVGSNDDPYVQHAPRLAEAIPTATLALIDGAHHSPQLTHPTEWLQHVERHLHSVDRTEPLP